MLERPPRCAGGCSFPVPRGIRIPHHDPPSAPILRIVEYAHPMPPDAPFSISTHRLVADGAQGPGRIVVADGRITAVQRTQNPCDLDRADIELGRLALMPGIVDAHVHVNEPGRTDWEGFRSAGRAAASGGVTTIIVMPLNCDPVATNVDALHAEAAAAEGNCPVDYGLWGGLVPGNTGVLEPMWQAGALGFKCFMVHSGIDEFPNITERDLDEALPVLADLGAVLLAHAEDPAVIDAAREGSGLDAHPTSYAAYLRSRPPESEVRAIRTLLLAAARHAARNQRLHVVHVSAMQSLPVIAAAKRDGLSITAETCPHYLVFDADAIPDGATPFKCAPPIRGRPDRAALWRAVADGTIDLIASDHSPCPPEMKLLRSGDFSRSWGGISSLQLTLPALGLGAHEHNLDLPTLSEKLSAAPARLAGIGRAKGRIAPGFDADLLIYDPDEQWTINAARLHHRHKSTPYDGLPVRGRVIATILRGRTIFVSPGSALLWPRSAVLDGDGLATEATGRWIRRT